MRMRTMLHREDYGDGTSGTDSEAKLWMRRMPERPLIMIRMFPPSGKFKFLIARRMMDSAAVTLEWIPNTKLPWSIVAQVLDTLAIDPVPQNAQPEGSSRRHRCCCATLCCARAFTVGGTTNACARACVSVCIVRRCQEGCEWEKGIGWRGGHKPHNLKDHEQRGSVENSDTRRTRANAHRVGESTSLLSNPTCTCIASESPALVGLPRAALHAYMCVRVASRCWLFLGHPHSSNVSLSLFYMPHTNSNTHVAGMRLPTGPDLHTGENHVVRW